MSNSVHPHACGENNGCNDPRPHSCRYTPTVWGKPCGAGMLGPIQSGTPPRVWGKLLLMRPSRTIPVHPHACGENVPRIRSRNPSRYTPTCVGKTNLAHGCRFLPVHPHVCGENTPPACRVNRVADTPQRVWGKRCTFSKIPTGLTGTPPRVWGKPEAELCRMGYMTLGGTPPRVWGKRSPLYSQKSMVTGTPPRVWGKLLLASDDLLIPGTPHVCGEN